MQTKFTMAAFVRHAIPRFAKPKPVACVSTARPHTVTRKPLRYARVPVTCATSGPQPDAVDGVVPAGVAPSDTASQQSTGGAAATEELVLELWRVFNTGVFSDAARLFSPKAVYNDTLYPSPFEGVEAIAEHFENMESAFGGGLKFVLDDLAIGEKTAGARWHVELGNGTTLPFSRGASMYRVEITPRTDEYEADTTFGHLRFIEAWDFPEPTIKAAWIALPVLGIAVKLLTAFPGLSKVTNNSNSGQT